MSNTEGMKFHPEGWGQPQPPRRRSKLASAIRGLIIASIVLFLVVTCSAVVASNIDTEAKNESSSEQYMNDAGADTSEDLPGAEFSNRDGKFEFTITKVQTKNEIGETYLSKKAQGRFILVSLKVENIGDEAQMFDSSSQKLVGQNEVRFDADSEAAIYLDDSNSFLNNINPGNTVNGILVFDVPKSVTPSWIELHDSMFSGGTLMELPKNKSVAKKKPRVTVEPNALVSKPKEIKKAKPKPKKVEEPSVYYENCTEVRAAGAAPISPSDPGWQSKFDRDGDGEGCE